MCFSLDGKHQIIVRRMVFKRTLTGVAVHPREVFAGALEDRAAAIIVAHNHPSGDVQPSEADIAASQHLADAGQILGIPLADHIIVGGAKYFSFRAQELLGPGR